jgi:Calcium-binding EGF domain/EGF domain
LLIGRARRVGRAVNASAHKKLSAVFSALVDVGDSEQAARVFARRVGQNLPSVPAGFIAAHPSIPSRAAVLALLMVVSAGLLSGACRKGQAGGERRMAGDAAAPDSGAPIPTSCDQLTCADPSECQVNDGKASCVCPVGYVSAPDNANACEDVDECNTGVADCDSNANCKNRVGSYDCTCKEGFSGNGKVCMRLDDCEGAANTCSADASCTRVDDGIQCTCTPGFSGEGHVCMDIDECANGSATCADNAHCENLRSNYDCECNPLFEGDGRSRCRDSCEVAMTDAARCDPSGNARCTFDHSGVASCTSCVAGYIGDGKTCAANSECAGLGCGDNTVCKGSSGQRQCACADGFSGDPKTGCQDIDECSTGAATCDTGTTTCLNTPGSYVCTCQTGLERVGDACVNIDECARGTDLCDSAAICTDQPTGYKCACKPGYTGDGYVCQDIDECANGSAGCPQDGIASCQNTRGSYECVCPKGYAGDPKSEACYCDLSGFWGVRQRAVLTLPERAAGNVVIIAESTTRATVWELDHFVYDNGNLRVENQPCGADRAAEIYSPLYMETYSSSIPNMNYEKLGYITMFQMPLAKSVLLPNQPFNTPHYAAVEGIHLDDPLNDAWPKTFMDVDASAWVDDDQDGEPGITLWPGATSQMTRDGRGTLSYLPVALQDGSTRIETRTGCVSTALRSVNHLLGRIESCGRLTGKVVNDKTEGRVHSCSVLRASDWDGTDVTCSSADWSNARRCTDDEIKFLDDQDQTTQASADFELVKLGDSTATNIDCAAVRKALPAFMDP